MELKIGSSSKSLGKKSRKEKKKIRKEKRSKAFEGERGFTYPYGYLETDAYLFLGERTVQSVFDVLFDYGTNNPAPIGWLLSLIPKEAIQSGSIKFVQRQKGMEKSTESDVVEKHLSSNIATMDSTKTPSAKQGAQNASRKGDMKLAAQLAGDDDQIIDSDVRLIIKGRTPEDVERIRLELKDIYKKYDVKGIRLVRRTGRQQEEMDTLFTDMSADTWHNSDMSTVAAGRLFLPSSGFSDEEGVFVGYDTRSFLYRNPAIIDFSGVRNAVIFMGGVHPNISVEGLERSYKAINGGSAVAHVIAESNYLAGGRTHHIVLSKFDYQAPDSLIFDMSKEETTLNPFEVFGKAETVHTDAPANFTKNTIMMSLLSGIYSTPEAHYYEAEIESVMMDWFVYRAGGKGMYSKDPEKEPLRAQRILATKNHKNYPKPTDFLPELKANIAVRAKEGPKPRERAEFLHKKMNTTFNKYPSIFKRTTTLPDEFKANDRNIYYDISKVSDNKQVTGAVFLNVLAYVTNRALEGELVVIHGLDQVEIPVEPINVYKEQMERKNVGLITVFEHSENKINPASFSSFIGKLSRQDAVVLGGLTPDELTYINKSWRRPISNVVADQLMQSEDGILYFYRKRDRVGALIDTQLVL